MTEGWNASADAWVASMGTSGDYSREHVLDPVMLGLAAGTLARSALDVGCGEGRFCRMLKAGGIASIGIDPTEALVAHARRRDPDGDYRLGRAEQLPFEGASFDLVVSYLTLVDIADFRGALREMTRVLKPGGALLIANLNSFISTSANGWLKDGAGRDICYPVDRYGEEFAQWVEWLGIRVQNWHRPLSAYMTELLGLELRLTHFDEPMPRSGDAESSEKYRRAPWFVVMQWTKV
jgi:ubiquinone/menaquinone biosynthesis C-methylase UbiE